MAWRLPVFLGVLSAMLGAETWRPARAWHDPRGRRLTFHLSLAAFNTVVTRVAVAWPLLVLTEGVHRRGWGLAGLLGLTGWVEVLSGLVVLDFLDYVWHVLNHRVPFLWRFHRAHHFNTHVDASTSLRFHLGELLLSGLMKAVWILAWGPSVPGFAAFEAAITAYAQFHHSNIDFPIPVERALRWVHMTPRLHAAHHTVTLRSRDANFSTVFLWWDRLFGTFAEADPEELKCLGLPEGRDSDLSWAAFLKAPWVLE